MDFLFESLYFTEDSDVVKMGFSTKIGGFDPEWGFNLGFNTLENIEHVKINREKYKEILGKDLEYAFAVQKHSNKVIYVDKGGEYEADGFVTDKRKLVLNILSADCFPVLAHDTQNKVIGCFHAGWRGIKDGIIENGISLMLNYGAKLKRILVYINPGIKWYDYEVQDDMLKYFSSEVFYHKDNKLYLDLEKEIVIRLKKLGVVNIMSNFMSTYREKNLYSYRRDKEKSGRFTSFIYLV
ncbi:MAG TPA: peptidoglycan editing factor PgeF [Spirochaetota bacterium]|nr:peptidoglycan editing factor PgeF [Spirochaetota bacterium]HOM38535.1 peptidoglycan editing factor PgeF [Spirochaetota bacterium]HPQ49075.1 peptidoglycan editing factor PgeF [Spirochaetota bacterium]